MTFGSHVDLRCFPSADRAFASAVAQIAAGLPPDVVGPEQLEAAIRQRFPEATVRPQDPLANLDGRTTWYVYRRSTTIPAHADAPHTDARPAAGPTQAAAATTAAAATPEPGAEPGPADAAASTAEPVLRPVRTTLADIPVYAPTAVAALVGVPLAVLVGWDERYGLVTPTRRGDRRLYSRNQVEELRRVKREVAAGRDPSELGEVLEGVRAARSRRPGPTAPAARRVLVLVAEQDPFSAEFVEYLLRTEGYGVRVAYDDGEAEAALADGSPEIAIVDILRPRDTGLELCARLAANGVRVIAIAAIEREDDALAAGADAFLPKPLQPLILLSVVRDLLGDSAFARDSA